MVYSMEFKRAVAAATVTRLIQGRRNLDTAARHVLARAGGVVFVTLDGERKVEALLDYRKRIMSLDLEKNVPPRLAIARFHYDHCLQWAESEQLGPEESAELLIDALLEDR